ncbi:MAG: dihydrodipicolinate synthase family protein, partial [Planctomycetes bacterium]|nr:dihydrodipicolinate synthase family protein [Planctomycetota bacterium]
AANIVPGDTARLVDSFLKGDTSEAARMHHKLFPLCKAMFIETNPIPVKTAMRLLGRLNGELRMPLCEMSKENEARLGKALRDYGLL